ANRKEDRKDRRKAENRDADRRVVIGIRQRNGRTRTFVTPSEAHGADHARKWVSPGSEVYADEASHWDKLVGFFNTKRINHSEAYSADGANTNAVESFFSRLRRMLDGQHHHVSVR